MSLASAVTMIADEMDRDVAGLASSFAEHETVILTLRNYANQLRLVVKASEPFEGSPNPRLELQQTKDEESTKRLQVILDKQHQRRLEDIQQSIERDEHGPLMVFCEGGDNDQTYVTIDSAMPIGAYTLIGGQRYRLRPDRKLEYAPPVNNQ